MDKIKEELLYKTRYHYLNHRDIIVLINKGVYSDDRFLWSLCSWCEI